MKRIIVLGLLAISAGAFAADAAANTEKPAATKKVTKKSAKKSEVKSDSNGTEKKEEKKEEMKTEDGKGGSGSETAIAGKKKGHGTADAGM